MQQLKNKFSKFSGSKFLCSLLASMYAITGVAITPSQQSLTIPNDAPLTIKLLDNCWDNRENIRNQQLIIDYLQIRPIVPSNYEVAWKTARLVYFIGNYGIGEKQFVNTKAGVKLFDYGVKAGEVAYKLNPDAVEGYYWYAIDLGSYGLANGIIASAMHAKAGMKALRQAMAIDPTYHWYGSSRVLGRYYQELPGIFGGSSSVAEKLFKSATTNAPKFDNNWIYLGQYYNSKGEYKEGLEACKKALSLGNALDGAYEEARYKREANDCVKKAQKELE